MSNGHTISHNFYVNPWYTANLNEITDENDAAEQIIRTPDQFLLNQEQVFEAEGGYATLALTLGAASLGAMTIFASSPRMFTYYSKGMMNFPEWVCLGATTFIGGVVGQQVGLRSFGDRQRYANHWMAYYHVKSQNRFSGKPILGKKPNY